MSAMRLNIRSPWNLGCLLLFSGGGYFVHNTTQPSSIEFSLSYIIESINRPATNRRYTYTFSVYYTVIYAGNIIFYKIDAYAWVFNADFRMSACAYLYVRNVYYFSEKIINTVLQKYQRSFHLSRFIVMIINTFQ